MLAPEGRRLLTGRPGHHEAGAREDPTAVCLDDPAVDPATHPEVIPGDDEPLHGLTRTSRGQPPARAGRRGPISSACSKTRATTSQPLKCSSVSWRASRV